MNETALMTSNNGKSDFTIGDAIKLALEIPSKDANGLTHTAPQAPLLHTTNSMGMNALILPVIDVQMDFAFFILFFCLISFS